jgi:Type I restriction modification DNA specificity domain
MKIDYKLSGNIHEFFSESQRESRDMVLLQIKDVVHKATIGIIPKKFTPKEEADLDSKFEVQVLMNSSLYSDDLGIDLTAGSEEQQILTYSSTTANHLLITGDVLVPSRYATFSVARVGEVTKNVVPNTNMVILRPNSDLILSEYLASWFKSKEGLEQIVNIENVVPSRPEYKSLTLSQIKELTIPVPPLAKQREVAKAYQEITLRQKEIREREELIKQIVSS